MSKRRMDPGLILLAIGLCSCLIVGVRDDRAFPLHALAATGRMMKGLWLDLLFGFLLAGALETLLPVGAIAKHLGTESGSRGICVAWLAGLAIPGGPYLLFPIAANLLKQGAAPGPLLTLLTAKTLVSPIRMLTYEAPLLGWPLTLARLLPGVFVPPLLGLIGAACFRALKSLDS